MDKPIGNTADFCIPATAAKTVTRSDLAFFKSIQKELTVVAKHSIYGGDNDVDLVLLERLPQKDKDVLQNLQHVLFKLSLSCLVPVSNWDDKLEKEVRDKQATMEKTMKPFGLIKVAHNVYYIYVMYCAFDRVT